MQILIEYDPNKHTILAEDTDPDGDEYCFVVDESLKIPTIAFATKKKQAINSFKDFLKKNSYMTGMAVDIGIDALDSYRGTNKRQMSRLFANNKIEKTLYTKMARDLVKTGNYTLIKNGRRWKNGWIWEFRRKGFPG
jgi:hypothetical protein